MGITISTHTKQVMYNWLIHNLDSYIIQVFSESAEEYKPSKKLLKLEEDLKQQRIQRAQSIEQMKSDVAHIRNEMSSKFEKAKKKSIEKAK